MQDSVVCDLGNMVDRFLAQITQCVLQHRSTSCKLPRCIFRHRGVGYRVPNGPLWRQLPAGTEGCGFLRGSVGRWAAGDGLTEVAFHDGNPPDLQRGSEGRRTSRFPNTAKRLLQGRPTAGTPAGMLDLALISGPGSRSLAQAPGPGSLGQVSRRAPARRRPGPPTH